MDAPRQAADVSPQEEMSEPVEESALRRTWRQFTETIPEEKLLIAAIQNSEVQLVEDVKVGVTVTSEVHLQCLSDNRARILNFIGSRLRNTHLELTLALVAKQGMRAAFTPRERMSEMREAYPELIEQLVDSFGLELA